MPNKKIVKCVYCGAEIEELDSNNPWDNGLHPEYDKYTDENPRYCCSNCSIVTEINRSLADMIRVNNYPNFSGPKYVAHVLRENAGYLEEHADELMNYYIDQARNR